MADNQYGLDNFLYTVKTDGKTADFHFWDPKDVTNIADVSVGQKEIPEGSTADDRLTAEYAYSLCNKQLNDKRDTRVKAEDKKALDDKQTEDARIRQEGNDFLANSQDNSTPPAKVDSDGTKVYNVAPPEDSKKK